MPRHWLVAIFTAIFSAAFALYAAVINDLNEGIVWSFYVFGDMFNTAMVGLFWAFTNDITRPDEANRTYGIIGLGGVLGGFIGATIVSSSVEDVGRAKLLLLCIVPMVLIAIIAFVVQRLATRGDAKEARRPAASKGKKGASAALEGARLVFKSKYLLAIAGLIGAYEVVSNIIDFQLAATVEANAESLEIDAVFALVGQVIGIGSIIVQLFLTSFVLRTFGIRVALMFLPAFILLGSLGFLILPTLFFAAAMSASDNALNYSINQSAKEALYTPTSPDETYKAKAFIDMFVQRFAKVISVVLNLAMAAAFASGVRWLSLITLGVLVLWFFLIKHAGEGFRERVAKERKGRGHTTEAEATVVEGEAEETQSSRSSPTTS